MSCGIVMTSFLFSYFIFPGCCFLVMSSLLVLCMLTREGVDSVAGHDEGKMSALFMNQSISSIILVNMPDYALKMSISSCEVVVNVLLLIVWCGNARNGGWSLNGLDIPTAFCLILRAKIILILESEQVFPFPYFSLAIFPCSIF